MNSWYKCLKEFMYCVSLWLCRVNSLMNLCTHASHMQYFIIDRIVNKVSMIQIILMYIAILWNLNDNYGSKTVISSTCIYGSTNWPRFVGTVKFTTWLFVSDGTRC